MEYTLHQPHQTLAPWVKDYWLLQGDPAAPPPERFLSDGGLEISFNLGDPLRYRGRKPQTIPRGAGCLFGIHNRHLHIRASGSVLCFGVRFQPGGAPSFFTTAAGEFNNDCVTLDSVWGSSGRELQERIGEAENDRERIMLLDRFLSRRLRHSEADLTLIRAAFKIVAAERGNLRIKTLASRLEIGPRRLERLFRERVGISPKQFCRLIRFRSLFDYLTRQTVESWAQTAQEYGYYDQSHLIDDFQYFTSRPPGLFFRSPDRAAVNDAKKAGVSDFSNTATAKPVILLP